MGEHLDGAAAGPVDRPRPAVPAPAAGARGRAAGPPGPGRLDRPHRRSRAGRRSRPRSTVLHRRGLVDQLPTGWRARRRRGCRAVRTGRRSYVWTRDRAPRGRHRPLLETARDAGAGARRLRAPPGRRARPDPAHGAGLRRRRGRAARARRPASGLADVAELDLRSLRSWLAKQQTLGLSRTTLARRATAARVFTALAAPDRPGAHRRRRDAGLPQGAAHAAGGAAGRRGERPDPLRRRAGRRRQPGRAARRGDAGAALRHRHPGRRAGRRSTSTTSTATATWSGCSARGARSAPCRSADRPLGRWTAGWPTAGPALRAEGAGPALFLGARGRRIDQRAVRTPGAPPHRRRPGRARHRPARPAPHRRHPPARGRRRPALGPGAPRARLPGHHAALHPRHDRPAARGLPQAHPRA